MSIYRDGVDKACAAQRIRAQLKPKADASSANRIFYCATCGAPVVDSPRARKAHAMAKPACAAAMG